MKKTTKETLDFLNSCHLDTKHDLAESLSNRESYNYLVQHLDRLLLTVNLIKKYINKNSKKHSLILDLGSFPYYLTVLLKKMGAEVVGVDSPKQSYWPGKPYVQTTDELSISCRGQNYSLKHHLINIEKDKLPYKNKFDAVILTEVLEHLILQPNFVIKQIHRALKPGGIVIITTPNAKYLMKLLAAIRGSNINEPYNLTLGAYGRHNREYIMSEVIDLLKTHNFQILDAQLVNFPKRHMSKLAQLKYALIDALTYMPFRTRKEGIIVVAKKYGPTVLREPQSIFRR